MVCWMTDRAADGRRASYRSSTRPATAQAMVDDLHYRLDVNTLHRDEPTPTQLGAQRDRPGPAAHDRRRCSSTSTAATAPPAAFILIDEATNDTVGAGMIRG